MVTSIEIAMSTPRKIYVDKGLKAIISFNPKEIDGPAMVTFDGSDSYTDPRGEPRGSIVSYYWSFSDVQSLQTPVGLLALA